MSSALDNACESSTTSIPHGIRILKCFLSASRVSISQTPLHKHRFLAPRDQAKPEHTTTQLWSLNQTVRRRVRAKHADQTWSDSERYVCAIDIIVSTCMTSHARSAFDGLCCTDCGFQMDVSGMKIICLRGSASRTPPSTDLAQAQCKITPVFSLEEGR